MANYEQKLNEFTQGKALLRLTRPVRDRADAFCDACGSTQPRTLYALKEVGSDRYHFVGDTCLKELAKRGAILKRFVGETGQAAYEKEMKRRAQEKDGKTAATEAANMEISDTTHESKSSVPDTPSTPAPVDSAFSVTALVIEAPEHYQTFVSLLSAKGTALGSGYAKEIRYEEVWQAREDGGLVLEKVKRERPDAVSLCVTRAWQIAHSQLEGSELQMLFANEGPRQAQMLPGPLLTLLGMVPKASIGTSLSLNLDNGGHIYRSPVDASK